MMFLSTANNRMDDQASLGLKLFVRTWSTFADRNLEIHDIRTCSQALSSNRLLVRRCLRIRLPAKSRQSVQAKIYEQLRLLEGIAGGFRQLPHNLREAVHDPVPDDGAND